MSRPAYTFLVCPDPVLALGQAREVLAVHGAADWPVATYRGDEELPPQFWQDFQSVGLFGGSKALFVRHAEAFDAAMLGKLSPLLAGFNEAAWPFFCIERPWERGKPKLLKVLTKQKFWTLADKRKWVWRSPGLTDKTLPDHLRRELTARGLSADGRVFQTLCRTLPHDAAALATELDKLALAAAGGSIEPAHLELVTARPSVDFWTLVSDLSEGRGKDALWRRVLNGESGMLFMLLGSLARDVRAMQLLLAGQAEEVKLPPWVKDKKTAQARRLGTAGLARVLDLALAAELSVKSGHATEGQALERLVAGLYDLFSPRSPQRRPMR